MTSYILQDSASDTGFSTDSEGGYNVVDVAPRTAIYSSQETVMIALSNALPPGPIVVEFKGEKRRLPMEATAKRLNSATIAVQAPIYFPVEKVTLILRHGTTRKVLTKTNLFSYQERQDALQSLLKDELLTPVEVLCNAFGLEPRDIKQLDVDLANTFINHKPQGFDCLGESQLNPSDLPSSSKEFPTLLHFAANFGLVKLLAEILKCPGALQACRIQNSKGLVPYEMAQHNGHYRLINVLQDFESKCTPHDLYESMTNIKEPDEEEESPYYMKMDGRVQPEPIYENRSSEMIYEDVGHDETVESNVYDIPSNIPVPGLADDPNYNPRFYEKKSVKKWLPPKQRQKINLDEEGVTTESDPSRASFRKSVGSFTSYSSNSSTNTTSSAGSGCYEADLEDDAAPPVPDRDYDMHQETPPRPPRIPGATVSPNSLSGILSTFSMDVPRQSSPHTPLIRHSSLPSSSRPSRVVPPHGADRPPIAPPPNQRPPPPTPDHDRRTKSMDQPVRHSHVPVPRPRKKT